MHESGKESKRAKIDNMIISDELMAAFLDGNTSAEDTMSVLHATRDDEELQEIIRISDEVDKDLANRIDAPASLPILASCFSR